MIKNYFKIAWRNLIRNKVYSTINILGLSIGMAVALLIALWIWDEVDFNKDFTNYDRLVRVMQNSTHGNNTSTQFNNPIPLAGELRTKYASDFRKVMLASWNYSRVLSIGDKKISKSGMFAEPEVLDMFSAKMLKGSHASLNDPSSIVLSRSTARAIFGDEDPIGQVLKIDNLSSLSVTGVYEDFPVNSDFNEVTFLMPWKNYEATQGWVKSSVSAWNSNSFQLFALLADNAEVGKVAAKVKGALTGHERKDKPEVLLQPMSKWHLYAEFKNGKNVGGAIQFVWMFGIIGIFVLLLACINFMNLSTARSEKRAKEVGIRKAVGSLRRQLILQFLGESVLIALLAFLLSLLLVQLSLPWFNQVAGKQMSIFWSSTVFWSLAIGFTLFTGLIAGSYPSFYLSSFSSVKVLKGTFKAGRFSSVPRKVLVVLQFTVSVSLIIGTLIVFQQIKFARNRPIGYTREGLITVDMNIPDLEKQYGILQQDLRESGAISYMAESGSPTTGVWANQSGFEWSGKDPNLNPRFAVIPVTFDFGKTVGWQFTDGRDFSSEYASDSAGVVLNEAAVKYMGFKTPVGETVKYLYSDRSDKNLRVLGVIRDMVMESPFDPVKPTIFMMDYSAAGFNVITIRINPVLGTGDAIPKIETVFKKHYPGLIFNYNFNDEVYANKFRSEVRVGKLSAFFAIFAIFISCLGLFGLASFMAEQRTKEIGIRKVLGATVMQLWSVLSKEFLVLVFLSFFIAIPGSYYVMKNWLQHYDYRTAIPIWIFFSTGAIAVLITLVTVSFQAVRAALTNPVKSLRTE